MGRKDQKYDRVIRKIGRELGGVSYNIYRPVYTSSAGTETLIATRQTRTDVQANRFQEPGLAGIDPYEIFSDIRLIEPGDVLLPVTTGKGPPLTVLTKGGFKATIGVLTDRVGAVYDGPDLLYSNIRFGWVGPSFPGSGLQDALEDSLKIPKRKAVIFKRQGIGMNPPIIPGHILREVNNDPIDSDGKSYYWTIVDMYTKYNITVLSLQGS